MEHSGSACASWRRGGGGARDFFFLITSQIIPPPFSLSNHVNDQGNENKALDSQLTLSSCYIRSRRSSLTGGAISAGETNLQAGILSPTPINQPAFLSETELFKLAAELLVCPLAHTLRTCIQKTKYYACEINPSQKIFKESAVGFLFYLMDGSLFFPLIPRKTA